MHMAFPPECEGLLPFRQIRATIAAHNNVPVSITDKIHCLFIKQNNRVSDALKLNGAKGSQPLQMTSISTKLG